mmetsp:Transcript_19694/g.37319  ORF Transcript_19694/g.37319 Transcript_19694/m.37319 type:complete len:196 (-) Transcript_19694:82-669(-)|eukprot:scaffold14755_cov157-Amphora_coffeaeformis.AAC.1
MKLFVTTLPLLLSFARSLAAAKKPRVWRDLQVVKDRQQGRRKLQKEGGVRGEKKDPDDNSGKSKKKLAKKDKCNRDRKSVTVVTTFDVDVLNPILGDSVSGTKFQFSGDYTGTWTQGSIEVTEDLVLGHDHLTFFDEDGELAGLITTQFDDSIDFAIVTGGYGEFACAQGAPTIEFPEADSNMVHVIWDLCVCYE